MSLSFRGASGEMLLHRLDLMGICVSTGSACDSQNIQISHVLAAMNLEKDYAEGTIRISLGKDNTISDANIIGDSIIKILVNG
jgi:cysteine desulfurase